MKPELLLPVGRLRPANVDDLDAVLDLFHRPEVRRYLCDDIDLPQETVAGMLAHGGELDPRGLGLWIVEQPANAVAGLAGLQPTAADAAPEMLGDIEVIIALDPDHWGKGLASTALDALIAHARSLGELMRLVAAVDAPNARSHRLMLRCGFTEMGRGQGPVHELVMYELKLLPVAESEA